MHVLLFHRQAALHDHDLARYASQIFLDLERFAGGVAAPTVLDRSRRDVSSGVESGEVRETPTLFIDGAVHRGHYDANTLLEAIT